MIIIIVIIIIGFPAQFSSFAMQFDIKSIRFHDSCDRLGDPSFEFFFIYSKLLFVQQTVQLSQWNFFFNIRFNVWKFVFIHELSKVRLKSNNLMKRLTKSFPLVWNHFSCKRKFKWIIRIQMKSMMLSNVHSNSYAHCFWLCFIIQNHERASMFPISVLDLRFVLLSSRILYIYMGLWVERWRDR